MTDTANVGTSWRAFLLGAEENLYRAAFPLASTCLVTYMAAALTLKEDDTLFHLLGAQLRLVVPAFVMALILRIFAAKPPKAPADRLVTGIVYAGTVLLFVSTLVDVGVELRARAAVHASLAEWKECNKKRESEFQKAKREFDVAVEDAKRCVAQIQSDLLIVELAARKREITPDAATAMNTTISKRCDTAFSAMEVAQKNMAGVKRCELPDRFKKISLACSAPGPNHAP